MAKRNLQLVAYCGLDCAECFGYKGTVSKAAKNLRRVMQEAGMKRFWHEIPFLGDYAPFKKALDGISMLHCPRACRGGGGNPRCKIRACCLKKRLAGCWECDGFRTCSKLDPRFLKNIVKIRKRGLAAFAAGG
jgi:hypothetical protein